MAAHHRRGARCERLGEVASHLHVGDEQISAVAECVANVPVRYVTADWRSHVHDCAEALRLHDREWHDIGAVAVHHCHRVRARLQHGAMDEPLRIRLPRFRANDFAVESKFHDVVDLDAHRRSGASHEKAAGVVRVTDRHVAERIEYVVVGENPVRGDEIFLQLIQVSHAAAPSSPMR